MGTLHWTFQSNRSPAKNITVQKRRSIPVGIIDASHCGNMLAAWYSNQAVPPFHLTGKGKNKNIRTVFPWWRPKMTWIMHEFVLFAERAALMSDRFDGIMHITSRKTGWWINVMEDHVNAVLVPTGESVYLQAMDG